jgi:hypothetical protein
LQYFVVLEQCILVDYLKDLPAVEVARFFRRLAVTAQKHLDGKSLAGEMLLHWLDGGGATKTFCASYVKDLPRVTEYLLNEVRPVLLSQKKAKLLGGPIWGGIAARLKGNLPAGTQPQLLSQSWPLSYEGPSLCPGKIDIIKSWLGIENESHEQDVFYALHTFGLVTDVSLKAHLLGRDRYEVSFERWLTKAIDTYRWDSTRKIKVPNPDFGSSAGAAIAPRERMIVVHYRHALRVEQAGLASSFASESTWWSPTDERLTQQYVIDLRTGN